METINEKPIIVTQEMADRLLEVTDPSSLSREERIVYEEVVKRYRDYKNTIDYAEERGIEKGKKEGKEEGLAEGIEKGRKEGLAEGREEGLIIAAQKMKAQNFPVSVIAQTLGLPPEEIEKL